MTNLLIIFHSQSGRSESLALHCYNKTRRYNNQVTVTLRRAFDVCVDDYLTADCLLFISPENFAAIAGGMKDALDRFFYPAERAGKRAMPYCLIVSAGNDGTNAVKQMDTILKGIGAKPVQPAQIIVGPPAPADFDQVGLLAQALVDALEMGIY